MIYNITITIPVDPTQYDGVEDTVEGALELANEMLFRAADLPDTSEHTISLRPCNDAIVDQMASLLKRFANNDVKHDEFEQLRESANRALDHLAYNKLQSREAKEI